MKLALAVLLVSSVAAADPTQYVEGGAATGISGDKHTAGAFVAGTVDGGYRLGDTPAWAHAMLAGGGMVGIDSGPTSARSYLSARLGLELRGCTVPAACILVGVDAGLRHQGFAADEGMFADTSLMVVPRVAADFGGTTLRIRPGGQLSIGANGVDGFALTLGVAYMR